jgi:hypothetical protein
MTDTNEPTDAKPISLDDFEAWMKAKVAHFFEFWRVVNAEMPNIYPETHLSIDDWLEDFLNESSDE